MGKKSDRAYTKKVYKRSTQKYYIKGDQKAERKIRFAELGVKAIALTFYPFYLAVSETGKLIKKIKTSFNQKSNFNHSKHKSKKQKPAFTQKFQNVKMPNGFSKSLEFVKSKSQLLTQNIMGLETKYKWAVGGVTTALLVSVIGVMTLGGVEAAPLNTAEDYAAHRVSAIEAEAETPLQALEEETLMQLPEFKVLSVASARAYEVTANGNVVARLKTENEVERLLAALKAEYTHNTDTEIVDAYFFEDVVVENTFVDIMDFDGYDTVESALTYIRKGTHEERKHTVERGENYWVIANYYGVSPYDLEAANPDIRPEALQIGMEISLVVPKPLITVVTVENATISDRIAFDVVYEATSSMYKGEQRTKTNGVYGERVIEAEIIKQNGREIARTVLSEDIVSEPKSRVVYQGTKDPPPRMGTGNLIRPTSRGTVSSEFGQRWGRLHTGIDIALPIGSEIRAADGGVVTFAGYSNSYGRYLIIDHGGNVSTLYAHNSQLKVSRGDRVHQGQLVALSGNTGYSTGPHLHFEVRINGVPQNPRRHVNF